VRERTREREKSSVTAAAKCTTSSAWKPDNSNSHNSYNSNNYHNNNQLKKL